MRSCGTQTCWSDVRDKTLKRIRPRKSKKWLIVKKNDKIDGAFPYYVICLPAGIRSKPFRNLKEKYPNLTIVHETETSTPNLFGKMKKHLTYIKTKSNHMAVGDHWNWLKDDMEILGKNRI